VKRRIGLLLAAAVTVGAGMFAAIGTGTAHAAWPPPPGPPAPVSGSSGGFTDLDLCKTVRQVWYSGAGVQSHNEIWVSDCYLWKDNGLYYYDFDLK
jgi:hypothetical protein